MYVIWRVFLNKGESVVFKVVNLNTKKVIHTLSYELEAMTVRDMLNDIAIEDREIANERNRYE